MRSATAARVCALALAAVVFAAVAVRGDCSYSTTGSGVLPWATAASWNGGAVPPSNSNCSITVTTGVTLTVNVQTTVGAVTLSDAAALNITATNGLNCASVAVFGDANITVASGASLVAAGLAPVGGGGEVLTGRTVQLHNDGTCTIGLGVQLGGGLLCSGANAPKLLGPATIAGALVVADASGPVLSDGLLFAYSFTPTTFYFRGPAAGETVTFNPGNSQRSCYFGATFAGTLIVAPGGATTPSLVSIVTQNGAGTTDQTAPATIIVRAAVKVFNAFYGSVLVQAGGSLDSTGLKPPGAGQALTVDGAGVTTIAGWVNSAGNGALVSGATLTFRNLAMDAATDLSSAAGTLQLCNVNMTLGAKPAGTTKLLDNCWYRYDLSGGGIVTDTGVWDKIIGGVNTTATFVGSDASGNDAVKFLSLPGVMVNAPATINLVNCGAQFFSSTPTGFRGTINAVQPRPEATCGGTGCIFGAFFQSGVSTHATDRLTLTGYGSNAPGSATHSRLIYSGALTVPTGGSVQLGAVADPNGGADFATDSGTGLTITRMGTGQIWLGTALVAAAACGGTSSNVVHGPVAGAQTVFMRSQTATGGLNLDTVLDWAGDFLFDNTGGPSTFQISSAQLISNSAKISSPFGDPGAVEIGSLTFVDTWTGSATLSITTSLSSSSPSTPSLITQAPFTLENSNVLQQSVCQSNCTFTSLTTTNTGFSFVLPANRVMKVNGGSFNCYGGSTDSGLELSAGSEFVLNSPNPNTHNLAVKLDASSILRLLNAEFVSVFAVDPASDASARVYIGSVKLPGTATVGPVQYFGPSAGATLTLSDAVPAPHLQNWAGTVALAGSDPSATPFANQIAQATATLQLAFNSGSSLTMNNVVLPAGSKLQSDASGAALSITGCYFAATFTGASGPRAVDITVTGTNSVLLSSGMLNSLTVRNDAMLTILNTNNANFTINSISVVSVSAYLTVANAAAGNRVTLWKPSNFVATAYNLTLDGVVLATRGDMLFGPGQAVGPVYLRNGGGYIADRLVYGPSQNLTQEVAQIVALDDRALINVNLTSPSPFDLADNYPLAGLNLVGCVLTGSSTLPGFVNITSKGLCPANADFAGCNDAACNSAAGARTNCSVTQRTHVCGCRTGFVGVECQTNVNDCVGVTCANGGSCVDLVNAYTCACVPGYSGPLCQTDINECASMPCDESQFRCVDRVNGYTCKSLTCPGNGNCNGRGVCQTGQVFGGDCSCYSGFGGDDCSAQAAALPDGVVELGVTGLTDVATSAVYRAKDMTLAAFVEAVRVALGLPMGSVTVVGTPRPGGSGVTIVVLNLNGDAAKADELLALIGNNQGVAASLNIVSGRKGTDGVVTTGSALTDNAEKTPVTDSAAIGLVIAGLIVVIIVVALVWYFCANTKDHDTAPKTRPTSNSNAGQPAAVELQVR